MNRRAQGARGEDRALAYLIGKGLAPVARNCRLAGGEIDLILMDGDYLVFCEVKLRTDSRFGTGREAVDSRKQARIRLAAQAYLIQVGTPNARCRFDVVEIQAGQVTHIPNAF